MRAWIAVALLAVSWLLGLGYYEPADWVAWTVAIGTAVVLLARRPERLPTTGQLAVAAVLMLPTAWLLPWPYRAAPLLVSAGAAVLLAPVPPRWPKSLGWGAIAAGIVLLAQSLAPLGLCELHRTVPRSACARGLARGRRCVGPGS